jgi:[lysine-biosynthesis-protein LysW]---L-2-aminoadipate ligase
MEKLAVLTTRVRLEEDLIFQALERQGIPYMHVDERQLIIDFTRPPELSFKFALNRLMSHTRSVYAAYALEAVGVTVLNSGRVIETCGDKIRTTLALALAGVPVPRTVVALSPRSAMEAVEEVGYPAVLKPAIGSWGRLLAKVGDRDSAEAFIEHKEALGSPIHSVFYVQEFINKRDRDIRTIVIGEQVIAAIYRRSEHWITNTARGATAEPCPLTPDLVKLSLDAAAAVGGGLLAVDLIERPDGELVVTEINHTMEFHGLVKGTGINLADHIAEYAAALLSTEGLSTEGLDR